MFSSKMEKSKKSMYIKEPKKKIQMNYLTKNTLILGLK